MLAVVDLCHLEYWNQLVMKIWALNKTRSHKNEVFTLSSKLDGHGTTKAKLNSYRNWKLYFFLLCAIHASVNQLFFYSF